MRASGVARDFASATRLGRALTETPTSYGALRARAAVRRPGLHGAASMHSAALVHGQPHRVPRTATSSSVSRRPRVRPGRRAADSRRGDGSCGAPENAHPDDDVIGRPRTRSSRGPAARTATTGPTRGRRDPRRSINEAHVRRAGRLRRRTLRLALDVRRTPVRGRHPDGARGRCTPGARGATTGRVSACTKALEADRRYTPDSTRPHARVPQPGDERRDTRRRSRPALARRGTSSSSSTAARFHGTPAARATATAARRPTCAPIAARSCATATGRSRKSRTP